jgi:hypothetical protein
MRLIPLDKSWTIRHGVLDLLDGQGERTAAILDGVTPLSDDIAALRRVLDEWPHGLPLDVGESGTLYRFLRFAAWARDEDREFIMRGTLGERHICSDPSIIGWPLEDLLTLDGGTSQWASAALLVRGLEALPSDAPHKLAVTAEALASRGPDGNWQPRIDRTLERQFAALPGLLVGERTFSPEHSEDYALARAFDIIDAAEGESRWPQLRGHESDRLEEMESGLAALPRITSLDHRIVQALAARALADGLTPRVLHPQAVTKSWPQFWDALATVNGGNPAFTRALVQ